MNKRITSLVLALVMVLGSFTTVFAAETTEEKVEKIVGKDNKIQYVIDKGLVEGYEDGSYKLDDNIKRSEITKLLVLANGNKELAEKLQGSLKLYSDVDNNHWANGVIAVGTTVPSDANGQAMLQGYPDGSFKPENNVTYAELAKMLVVLAKKDLTADDVVKANNQWATLWLRWAAELGILDDVTVANSDAPATRGDAFTMVYNALYKMVSFKRQAANDEIGVLSSLRNDKLVLNQDEKQEYTLTTETNFVRPYEEGKVGQNVIKVKNITNPDYYLGSLVRIIFNDNKEVTHILELGNPEALALGLGTNGVSTNSNEVLKNSRWEGVAKNTVETGFTNVTSAKSVNDGTTVANGYATIQTKSDRTEATDITFHYANGTVLRKLDINDDTKVYVANPGNNQMRKVDNVDAALALIGYQNYDNGYRIPNVYAGFDTDSFEAAYKPAGNTSNALAKVIVFNSVNRAKSGDKFRIINETSIPGNIVLEKKDGSLVERNNLGSISNFPYNYGDLLDVVSIKNFATRGYDERTVIIDHSDTKLFPIVEVTAIDKDSKALTVRGADNYSGNIYYRDADVFSAKRYDNLEVGTKLQFRLDTDHVADYKNPSTLDVSAISLLPRDTAVKGSLRAVLGDRSINADRAVGYIRNVDGNRVSMDIYDNPLDKNSAIRSVWFDVTSDLAAAILRNNLIVPGREINIDKAVTVLTEDINTGKKVSDMRLNKDNHPLVQTYTNAPANALVALEEAAKTGSIDFTADPTTGKNMVDRANDYVNSLANQGGAVYTGAKDRVAKAILDNAEYNVKAYELRAPEQQKDNAYKTILKDKAQASVNELTVNSTERNNLQARIDKAFKIETDVVNLFNAKEALNSAQNPRIALTVSAQTPNLNTVEEVKNALVSFINPQTGVEAVTANDITLTNVPAGNYYVDTANFTGVVTLKAGDATRGFQTMNVNIEGRIN